MRPTQRQAGGSNTATSRPTPKSTGIMAVRKPEARRAASSGGPDRLSPAARVPTWRASSQLVPAVSQMLAVYTASGTTTLGW